MEHNMFELNVAIRKDPKRIRVVQFDMSEIRPYKEIQVSTDSIMWI